MQCTAKQSSTVKKRGNKNGGRGGPKIENLGVHIIFAVVPSVFPKILYHFRGYIRARDINLVRK